MPQLKDTMTRLNEPFSELLSEYIKLSLVWDAWMDDDTGQACTLTPQEQSRMFLLAREIDLRCPPNTPKTPA